MKDFFNQAIADGLNELGYSVDVPNEKGEMLFGPECHEVCTIAEKLNALIESWPVVYGSHPSPYWYVENIVDFDKTKATTRARLAFIEEINKGPCNHEPNEIEITMNYEGGFYSQRLGTFDMKKLGNSKFRGVQSICKHCGVELQATWSEKDV